MRSRVLLWGTLAIIPLGACNLPGEGGKGSRLEDDHLEARDPLGSPTSGSITPVLFVPTDKSVSSSDIQAVEAGLCDLEAWYERELGDKSLRLTPLAVVDGQQAASYYLSKEAGQTSDRIWTHGPAELEAALGFSPWDSGHIVLLIGAGLLGWAGGAGNGSAGYAVLGLDSLTNTSACSSEWWCNPTVWRGTAIHELGHALTLPHSAPPSIMDFHGDYLSKVLLDSSTWPEKSTVRGLPFAEDLGSDAGLCGQANWTPCSDDSQCKSSWCGCNYGPDMLCLPHNGYPKNCQTPKKANWEPCAGDADCQSSWCGCNYGPDMLCLPHSGYPKSCQAPKKANWEPCSGDADCQSNWCGCNGATAVVCLPNSDYPKTCASQSGSCVGHCGGSSDGCWCDSSCQGYGDCCPDKVSVCGP
jgi:hypothetical protein